MKYNCWEVKKCGREEGGSKVQELGVCKASTDSNYEGRNSGKNGGRYCWHVKASLCGGRVQGNYLEKAQQCIQCEFYKIVKEEEGEGFEY